MSNLVQTNLEVQDKEGVLVVDSRVIAERLGIQHDNFLQTLEAHRASIEAAFGIILFETGKIEGRGRPSKYTLLTEEQATALMTLSRNTPQVVELKIALVQAFSEARKARSTVLSAPPNKYALMRTMLDQIEALDETVQHHETRLQRLEERTSKPSNEAQSLEYYTVTGWARRFGMALPHEKALKYGRKAASLSKANGVLVSKIADAKYGQVNAYHADILKVVFSQRL